MLLYATFLSRKPLDPMLDRLNISKDNVLDKVGIAATSLCALHCILLPIMLPVLPLLGISFMAEEMFEHIVLIATLVLGAVALLSGFFKFHRKLYPLYLLGLGGIVYGFKDEFGHHNEPWVLSLGAILIVIAHIMNIKLCKSCDGPSCSNKN